MNLFVTHSEPRIAATHLDDIRLNKMIVESCQMMVLAAKLNGATKFPLTKAGTPYKAKGHINHPVVKWTATSDGNYLWHLTYLGTMLGEYHYRTGKTHAGMHVYDWACQQVSLFPKGAILEFQNSSLFAGKGVVPVIIAYINTMIHKWQNDKIKVKWTKRKPPEWCKIRTVQIGDTWYRVTAAEDSAVDQMLVGEHQSSSPTSSATDAQSTMPVTSTETP